MNYLHGRFFHTTTFLCQAIPFYTLLHAKKNDLQKNSHARKVGDDSLYMTLNIFGHQLLLKITIFVLLR